MEGRLEDIFSVYESETRLDPLVHWRLTPFQQSPCGNTFTQMSDPQSVTPGLLIILHNIIINHFDLNRCKM